MVNLAQPVRVALTGNTASPGLYEIISILGKPETLRRLRQAIGFAEGHRLNTFWKLAAIRLIIRSIFKEVWHMAESNQGYRKKQALLVSAGLRLYWRSPFGADSAPVSVGAILAACGLCFWASTLEPKKPDEHHH